MLCLPDATTRKSDRCVLPRAKTPFPGSLAERRDCRESPRRPRNHRSTNRETGTGFGCLSRDLRNQGGCLDVGKRHPSNVHVLPHPAKERTHGRKPETGGLLRGEAHHCNPPGTTRKQTDQSLSLLSCYALPRPSKALFIVFQDRLKDIQSTCNKK